MKVSEYLNVKKLRKNSYNKVLVERISSIYHLQKNVTRTEKF